MDSPAGLRLNMELQAEYVRRYGEVDHTVLDGAQFVPPAGSFCVGYTGDRAVAMGGWRRHGDDDAEMKRVYVAPDMRGRGYSRGMVEFLEHDAAAAGRNRMMLVTGLEQPEAMRLYASLGYEPVTPFGIHAGMPSARHLGKLLHVAPPAELSSPHERA